MTKLAHSLPYYFTKDRDSVLYTTLPAEPPAYIRTNHYSWKPTPSISPCVQVSLSLRSKKREETLKKSGTLNLSPGSEIIAKVTHGERSTTYSYSTDALMRDLVSQKRGCCSASRLRIHMRYNSSKNTDFEVTFNIQTECSIQAFVRQIFCFS